MVTGSDDSTDMRKATCYSDWNFVPTKGAYGIHLSLSLDAW